MYIAYKTATGLVTAIKRTQAEVDTIATADATVTAHQGNLTVPWWVNPDRAFFKTADSSFVREIVPTPTDLEVTKAVYRAVHKQYYEDVYPRVHVAGDGYPPELLDKVLGLLLGQVRAVYLYAQAGNSHALKRSHVKTAILGPTEITGHGTAAGMQTLFSQVRQATLPSGWVTGRPCTFVKLNTDEDAFVRRGLQASIDAAATDFGGPEGTDPGTWDGIVLSDPGWIDLIT